MWAAMQQTTGCSLMRFFTDIERESLGVICPRVLAIGTSYTSALTDGRRAAFSIAFSNLALARLRVGVGGVLRTRVTRYKGNTRGRPCVPCAVEALYSNPARVGHDVAQ